MLKKTQLIELKENIKKTKISFISIFMFVVLGITIFLGMGWTGESLRATLDDKFDEANAHDYQVIYPYEVTKQDVEELRNVEGIDEVEGSYVAYASFVLEKQTLEAKIVSINSNIDKLYEIEGRLPEKDNEIVVDNSSLMKVNLNIGDKISFFGEDSNTSYLINYLKKEPEEAFNQSKNINDLNTSYMKADEYTIVGIAKESNSINLSDTAKGQSMFSNVQVDAVFYCNYSAFDEDVVSGYNYVLIRNNSLRNISVFDKNYKKITENTLSNFKEALENLGTKSYRRVKDGYNNIDKYIGDKLTKAKNDIENGKKEIATNETKLKTAKKQLDAGKIELEEGKKQLDESLALLNSSQNEYDYYKAQVDRVKDSYNKLKSKYLLAKNGSLEEFINSLSKDDIELFKEIFNDSNIEMIDNYDTYVKQIEESATTKLVELAGGLGNAINAVSPGEACASEVLGVVNNSGLSDSEKYQQIYVNVDGNGKTLYEYMYDFYKESKDKEGYEDFSNTWAILHRNFVIDIFENVIDSLIMSCFNDVDAKLANAKAELDDGWSKYYAGKGLYDKSKKEYDDGLVSYNSGIAKLKQAKIDLENGEKEYEQGLKDYEVFRSKSNLVKDYGTVILTRVANAATMYVGLIADVIANIKYALGGLFLLIGFMICYSVVTRIVHDQIREIGTKKALGLMKKEITLSYLAYTGLAVISGGLLGGLIARFVVEPVLAPSVSGAFSFDVTYYYSDIKGFLLLFFFELITVLLITYFSCSMLLNRSAIKLLQGEEAGNGKQRYYETTKIWKKLPLFTKTIVNNFVNDKRRVIAMIIGVMGCTVLTICALTLRNNILTGFGKQFSEYYIFDTYVTFDGNQEGVNTNIEKAFEENNVNYSKIYKSLSYTSKDNKFKELATYFFVYDEDDPKFYELVNFVSSDRNTYEKGETWMAESVKMEKKLKNDDSITVQMTDGATEDITINGYFHYFNYLPQMYMSKTTYKEVFGEDVKYNAYIIDTDNVDVEKLTDDLSVINGFGTIDNFEELIGKDAAVFTSIANVIVILYMVVSILMAIFVLLNLLTTYVDEKKREIIVLLINGFSLRQAKRYIYSDTILITIIGVLLGVVFGILAGDYCIKAFESIYVYLMHSPHLGSCLIGSSLTIVLTIIMTIIALRKIDKFKLTDINKV